MQKPHKTKKYVDLVNYNDFELGFLPAAVEVQHRPVNQTARAMMMLICFALILAALWSYFTKLDVVATAQGRLMPVGSTQPIYAHVNGNLHAIHVTEGEFVEEGQILLEIDIFDVMQQAEKKMQN